MPPRLRTPLLTLFATTALGAGCASTNGSEAQTPTEGGAAFADSAAVAGVADVEDDLVGSGAALLAGAAVWDTLSVGGWMALAATTPADQARAREIEGSGAYVGDERLVARLQPGTEPGTATVTVDDPVGTAFESSVLHRFDGGGGRLDLTFVGESAGGGRQMPSLLRVSFFLDDDDPAERRVVVYVGGAEGEPSELASASLPQTEGNAPPAHEIDVQYVPGSVVVLLNGEPVVEAQARLGGGSMTASVTATAPAETRAYLLRWVLDLGQ